MGKSNKGAIRGGRMRQGWVEKEIAKRRLRS